MHDFNLKIKTKYTSYLLTSVQFKNKITEVILIIKKKKNHFHCTLLQCINKKLRILKLSSTYEQFI